MLDSYRDLIDSLLDTPSALREVLDAHAAGDAAPAVRRLVAELRDRDRAVLARLQTVMAGHDPRLPVLETSSPEGIEDTAGVLAEMDTARGDLISLLMNLTLKDWERTATHETDGEITLAEEVERHVEFDEDHLARVRAVVAMA